MKSRFNFQTKIMFWLGFIFRMLIKQQFEKIETVLITKNNGYHIWTPEFSLHIENVMYGHKRILSELRSTC